MKKKPESYLKKKHANRTDKNPSMRDMHIILEQKHKIEKKLWKFQKGKQVTKCTQQTYHEILFIIQVHALNKLFPK